MGSKGLYSALKQAIDTVGIEVVNNPQLYNILSDFHAYDIHSKESMAEKSALKNLVISEYGEQLLLWKYGQINENEAARFLDDILAQNKLEHEAIKKVAIIMQAALGLAELDPLNEITSLDETYVFLKEEYLKLITQYLVINNDCLGLKIAYYPPGAVTELYRIEGQLAILARALNENITNVVGRQFRDSVCAAKSDSPKHQKEVAQSVILSEYPSYQKLLQNNLEKSRKLFSKEGAKYLPSTINSLQSAAERLNRAHAILNDGKSVDCAKDMASEIEKYRKQLVRIRSYSYVGIAIIAVFILMLGIDKVRCYQNRDAIMAFNATIASGDNMASHRIYEQSLKFYQQAAEEYTCGYHTHHYQGIAKDRAKTVSSDIVAFYSNRIDKYLVKDDYYNAAKILKSIPSGIVLPRKEMNKFISDTAEYYDKLAISVERNRDRLLSRISTQHGKCTDADREEINRMLECFPGDYYLQVIKKKME